MALTEVLIIAAAFSLQDVRDRPLEQQQAADNAHRSSTTSAPSSAATSKLWKWLEDSRAPRRAQAQQPQQEQLLRENFISPRREWRDMHSQLHTWWPSTAGGSTPRRHLRAAALSLLPGCSATSAARARRRGLVPGARASVPSPSGAHLSKKPGRWMSPPSWSRPRACSAAALPPSIRLDPASPAHHQDAAARAALGERSRRGDGAGARHALRHRGLQQPARELRQRRCPAAREIFIREALVNGEWDTRCPSSPPTAS